MLQFLHNDALGKLILRLSVAILFLFHGVGKLLNPGAINWIGEMIAGYGLPGFLAYGVLIGEVIAPLMAIVGWQTRLAGLLMAGNMVVAFLLVHTGELFMLTKNGGWQLELQGMFLFASLAVMFLGSGRLALKPD